MDLKESIVDNKDARIMMMMMTMTTKMMTKDDDDAFPGDDPTIQILGCSTKAPLQRRQIRKGEREVRRDKSPHRQGSREAPLRRRPLGDGDNTPTEEETERGTRT